MLGGGLSPFVGIAEGEMEGYAAGSGIESNIEANSFDSFSPSRCDADLFLLNNYHPTGDHERSYQLPYSQQFQHGHAKTNASDTTLITPAGQVPSWTSSLNAILPDEYGQLDLNFFSNAGHSEPESLLYTL